jgi:hypothetical protein
VLTRGRWRALDGRGDVVERADETPGTEAVTTGRSE